MNPFSVAPVARPSAQRIKRITKTVHNMIVYLKSFWLVTVENTQGASSTEFVLKLQDAAIDESEVA